MCWTIIMKSGIPWALEGGGSIYMYTQMKQMRNHIDHYSGPGIEFADFHPTPAPKTLNPKPSLPMYI